MDKAIFINGGAGRVICAIPAIEKHVKNNPGTIVVSEAWGELFLASPLLRDKAFMPHTKGLFENYIKDRECISAEPYRVREYYNQECNLMEAFDIEINGGDASDLELNFELSKQTQVTGYNFVEEAKKNLGKEKAILFQPWGQGAKVEGRFIIDSSGRSFELVDVLKIMEELSKDAVVILMSTFNIPTEKNIQYVWTDQFDLLAWMGVTNAVDHILACDSVAQHFANALKKPATVVIGATFPENITYQNNPNFKIFDIGKDRRVYSPIRIVHEPAYELNNEGLMLLDDDKRNEIINYVKEELNKNE